MLQKDLIQVSLINVNMEESLLEEIKSLLNKEEQTRSEKFHFEKDRRRFIVAHAALQKIIQQILGVSGPLEFLTNSHGKPFLKNHSLDFNLSHSEDWVLLALVQGHSLGVDIEKINPKMNLDNIARRFFTLSESQYLRSLPEIEKLQTFYSYWVRKEALIKALGLGLSLPLDQFELSPEEEETIFLEASRKNWTVRKIQAPETYQAALVAEGSDWDFEQKDWNWEF